MDGNCFFKGVSFRLHSTSTEFRRFEDDLITDARWDNKDTVLREVGLPVLLAAIQEALATLLADLEAKLCAVNLRIAEGLNQHIKVPRSNSKRHWTLVYPTAEEPDNHPFYSQLPGISIADLLRFVASATGFLKGFTHVLDRYVKHNPSAQEILACIVAMGTNMGLWKMAVVAGLGHPSLMTVARNYLRLETLHAANDAISNATASLLAFQLFKIRDALHSSSDGQRIPTQINTFNARHSPKYFGLQKAVSSYTLVANHVPINAKIIGTHEYESHYVFDLLYNNTTNIKPERYSTDTHGTNQVNFWILHAFGYRFAPGNRDLHKKMESLVGAMHPRHYDNAVIKPTKAGDVQRFDRKRVAEHSTHHGVAGAKRCYTSHNRAQIEQLRPPESDQEGPVGIGKHLSNPVHPGFHR